MAIKVLIADDSAFMRKELRRILEKDPQLQVVGFARHGEEVISQIRQLQPDVVTLDINMPLLDGLSALAYIMTYIPVPVVMVSSLTADSAMTTFEALELGAVDYVTKPGGTVSADLALVEKELQKKVIEASYAQTQLKKNQMARESEPIRDKKSYLLKDNENSVEYFSQTYQSKIELLQKNKKIPQLQYSSEHKILLFGQSTGGPNTISEILPNLNYNSQLSLIIVQHMPGAFTAAFASRLSKISKYVFKLIENNMPLEPGYGYVAPGDFHTQVVHSVQSSSGFIFKVSKEPQNTLYKPSVDVTLNSLVENFFSHQVTSVILTGMGSDGAEASLKLFKAGGTTIAESDKTAIVFGMPKETIRLGAAQYILPSYDIAKKINELHKIPLKEIAS